ncbi:MAG: ABC transporter substrate-binding protein [Rhodospirillaceae bacterium]|nr:ABC transporter substrate-binding protein [Rhodospirillaceae bacterium]
MTLSRTAAIIALAIAAARPAAAEELRVGFLATRTGGLAVIGLHMENGWKLGLDSEGWKKNGDPLGGVPATVAYGDDQGKTDVGLGEVERMIKSERVQVIAGVLASNVMMAIHRAAFDAGVAVLSANAGPAPLAGALCSRLFVSASFMNDQNAEATGELATREKVGSIFLMAPNYQAGKDNIAGFQRTYRGKIAGQILFKLGESDFQADFARVRAAAPAAVFVFAPAAMGISFMKQWAASGLGKSIKLYTLYVIDNATLPAIGAAAIGAIQTSHWNPDLDNPLNRAFLRDYAAKFGAKPSLFAMQGYDAARALAAAARKLGGKISGAALAKTIRADGLASVRGTLKYNVNGFPIQPYWKLEIAAGPDGKPAIQGRDIVMQRPDSFWQKCPADRRL